MDIDLWEDMPCSHVLWSWGSLTEKCKLEGLFECVECKKLFCDRHMGIPCGRCGVWMYCRECTPKHIMSPDCYECKKSKYRTSDPIPISPANKKK